jgi:hypothetical protein
VPAVLSITKRAITVAADSQTKVYGQDDPGLGYRVTVGELVGGDGFTGGLVREAGQDVGNYEIRRGTLSAGGNYELTFVPAVLSITRAALSITASSPEPILLGAATPTISADYSGFVPGESQSVLTSAPVCGTTYRAGSAVGSYVTICSGASAQNYAITYINGSFRVMYGWNGFLQPINDTAHQVSVLMSKFKPGQTIPVKFTIVDVNNAVVQQPSAPTFKATRLGDCGMGGVSEELGTMTPDTGSAYKWDGGQYHYNWSTKGLSTGLYRVRALLSDNNDLAYVDICLTK